MMDLMIGPEDLYKAVVERFEYYHVNGDLFCKVSKETSDLIRKYRYSNWVSQEGDWYKIPGAYMPYWEE